ncbi:hypothetical protein AB4Y85_10725 [Microvirga sp. 2YAF29]|uniref:hypothetical protein n=1 Tax=Microvirga sp. 2YAF29 TaxID=3233031 RepID=UPI003F9E0AD6
MKIKSLAALSLLSLSALTTQVQAGCSAPPVYFNGNIVEVEGPMTVNAGTGCSFNVNGIPGMIEDVKITQPPKTGRAGVENLRPYYVAKPKYQGADEFTYTILGKDQYGGPMRISIKRKVTVTP